MTILHVFNDEGCTNKPTPDTMFKIDENEMLTENMLNIETLKTKLANCEWTRHLDQMICRPGC